MSHSPFKFLDSYTKDDREIFFGREREFEGCLRFIRNSKRWGFFSQFHIGL
jgi:hypothetical protein